LRKKTRIGVLDLTTNNATVAYHPGGTGQKLSNLTGEVVVPASLISYYGKGEGGCVRVLIEV